MSNDFGRQNQGRQSNQEEATTEPGFAAPPAITLPKGGGAIRGIGEKFAANPVTGTGALTVPIATSPGRSGFGPELALAYDSGAGNGPFGLGWSLSLPAIRRKTDKGLPRYQDADESDVFILSGAEDLVPVLENVSGQWQRHQEARTIDGVLYQIQRYRPRVEGLFARIERWTDLQTGEIHWRSITRENVTTLYGKTAESRIADPDDPARIFSWLICQSYDDKGNAIVYEYVAEDSEGVALSQIHEKNRTPLSRSANRYLKRVKYGNRTPNRDPDGQATDAALLSTWMFEVVFDYDEGHYETVSPPGSDPVSVSARLNPDSVWPARQDPFSTYRAGFEVRTYRLCHRVLMFHHFPEELGVESYLVRSTDLIYDTGPIASFITSVSQSGYARQDDGSYRQKSLPPLEFEYSKATISDQIADIDPDSLKNLPYGLDGTQYRWVDLDGEGISGILTEQADAWYYKPNVGNGRFAPIERVVEKPSFAALNSGRQQLLDLAGDGQLDLAMLDSPTPGFYERTHDERWATFRTFTSLPNIAWNDPNLRFVDLTGDGHTEILITEEHVFNWHLSLAEAGFGSRESVRQLLDEEQGPRLVFADGTQSIYLVDLSGDGLTDLARICNGEVCYWPNLGYGRFGAKVTMDNAPWFDAPDLFSQRRIQLADIDGSGTTDIIYLRHDIVDIYRNQSGNGWEDVESLVNLPNIDDLSSVTVVDLLGNGTACLVWSSPLPGDTRQPMRYLDLMGGQKPHLIIATRNNMGAETHVQYAPSTKFYLQDKRDGNPWLTRLPFPVHVVERVETYDHLSGNRFVTHHTYHHGYFDGVEREFRGFGRVEQIDTEEFAALSHSNAFPTGDNVDEASHVPPVLTKTWFHTGAYRERERISRQFEREYYREPGLSDAAFAAQLLVDSILPSGLGAEAEREACRALKGSMLRQEVYALDGTDKQDHPYTVTEQNFAIEPLQPHGPNRHAVFLTHAREAISYHYERNPADPRISHALTLEVDAFGNVLKASAVGYGRRQTIRVVDDQGAVTEIPNPALGELGPDDRKKQTELLVTYTENRVTNPIDDLAVHPDDYRAPLPCEARTYELTGLKPESNAVRFSFDEWTRNGFDLPASATEIPYEQMADNATRQKRLIEHVRTLYRADNLTGLLSLGVVEPLALSGEVYQLALTPELLAHVFKRKQTDSQLDEVLLPNPATLLVGKGEAQGGYITMDGNWWFPSGRAFFDPDVDVVNPANTATQELGTARQHFFLSRKVSNPFAHSTVVEYDRHDLLVTRTSDAVGNTIAAANDYRVLQPQLVTDPNRNRTAAAFDVLGMVVATAVMGKEGEDLGDLLEDFELDPTLTDLQAFIADPQARAASLLGKASSRIVYDMDRYQRTGQPPFAATLARESHFHDPLPAGSLKIQFSFAYSDGFGREIQQKIQAEAGDAPQRQPDLSLPLGDIHPGDLVRDALGELVQANTPRRWVGTGRTVFNNKGKPVRQYEPFFSATHLYEPEREMTDTGVSPDLFYDPVERVVATLHPNHTYEKVVFDPWQQTTYDGNDTVAARGAQTGDPRTDPDIEGYVSEYFKTQPATWQSWHAQRIGNQMGVAERDAADKAAGHADTPTVAYLDALGRPFLTVAHNRYERSGALVEEKNATRVELDLEGNERSIRDAKDRVVMRYDYDMLGSRIHQASMEAGERWMLNDVAGNPIRAWDSRGHILRTEYDPLRRPLRSFTSGADSESPNQELLTDRLVYGEQHPEAEQRNLRGTLYLHLDQAGLVTTEALDFKENPLRSSRRLATEYRQAINWSAVDAVLPSNATVLFDSTVLEAALAPLLEIETYTSRTTYDALNRPIQMIVPRSNQPDGKRNVIQPGYNEANLLERIDVWLDHPNEPAALLDRAVIPPSPVGVNNIDYDAKGQRQRIAYKNGATTHYGYDPETFRLIQLYTRRGAAFTEDCGNDPPPPRFAAPEEPPSNTPCGLQNLHYTYDPVGNITHIRDDAQQAIYFRNKRVEPSNDYTYDAVYRLIEASGREHLGQVGGPPSPHSADDAPRVGHPHPNSGEALGTYTERYLYDSVGNFLEMQHRGTDPSHPGWTRAYRYEEASLIEDGLGATPLKFSNRLSSTLLGNGNQNPEPYAHDPHGNMTSMPHLSLMRWDYRDQLQATSKQVVNNGTPETTWYVYDAAGQRARKVTDRQADAGQTPGRKTERIYLGGFEVYREYDGSGNAVTLERETLHIMDDQQRIALVETKTFESGLLPRLGSLFGSPTLLIRYQLGNHLGSASLELDEQAQVISYEEYYPYGSTSYQAGRSQTEVKRKRYRYTGMERDEESGLSYHSARYYLPWLGRWGSTDPGGMLDGGNLYRYTQGNPINSLDLDGFETHGPSGKKSWMARLRNFGQSTIVSIAEKTGRAFFLDRNPETERIDLPRSEGDMEKEKFEPKKKVDDSMKDENQDRKMKQKKGSDVKGKHTKSELAAHKKLRALAQRLGLSDKAVRPLGSSPPPVPPPPGIKSTAQAKPPAPLKTKELGKAQSKLLGSPKIRAAGGGLVLIDTALMVREYKISSKYEMGTIIFSDINGEFTLSEYRGPLNGLWGNVYTQEYISGDFHGIRIKISEKQYDSYIEKHEASYGYIDWWGDFVPGTLRQSLPDNEKV